jgi:hypothetical protein
MLKDVRIQLAVDNWDEYVFQLAAMPDKRLSEKLDVIDMQAQIAIDKKISSSVELLEIWRAQVIEARILKAENNIIDAPNEIELAIADVESTVTVAEQREEIFDKETANHISTRRKVQEDNSDQMSLF